VREGSGSRPIKYDSGVAADRDDQTLFGASEGGTDAPMPAGIPKVGEIIAEKFHVERILGIGGMGVVLAVRHLQLGEPYAIKCLLPRGAADPETVERFMREARAAVRIKSEHIARVSDVGQLANGSPYILMEHLTGRDLSDVLSVNGPLSIRDAVEYVLQACTGIAEAHALGIVHRDLKPSNLFLTQRLDGPSLVKVLDFGISKSLGEAAPHNPSLTQTSSVFGSPAYMSPEQIRSAKNVDFRTDVWSLGIILHELLTGALPFTAETAGGLLSAIAADQPHGVRERRPDVSEELEVVIRRCLEKNVKNRFQSVSELAEALAPFADPGSLVSVGRIRRLSAPPSDRLPHLAQPSSGKSFRAVTAGIGTGTERSWATGPSPGRRGWALHLLVALAFLASAAVAALFVMRWRQTAPGPPPATAVSALPLPPSEPTVVATPSPPPVEPANSATASTTGTARTPATVRSGRAGVSKAPHPAPSAAVVPTAVVAPTQHTPPPPSGAPRDPTLDSH
jgi:eukaryotic-like serine/threonine-protein kinase